MIKSLILVSLFSSPTVLLDVTIHHSDGRIQKDTNLVFDSTKIISIGDDIPTMDGLKKIDAKGKILIPGIVESVSQIGLTEVGMVDATNDYSVENEHISRPLFDPSIAFNPLSTRIPINRRGGVTHIVVAPRGGILSGIARTAILTGRLEDRPKLRPEVALFARATSRAARQLGGSRAEIWRYLDEVVRDARYAAKNARVLARGDGRELILTPAELAVVSQVLNRRMPLVVEAHQANDILNALDFAKRHRIRLIINGGSEAWLVRKELSDAKVPVIVYQSQIEPWGFEAIGSRDDLAAMLVSSGVPVILSAGGWDQNARRLRQEAGIAVAHGMPRAAALAAITSTPAEYFGLGSEVGTISVGENATFGLYSADPFELDTELLGLWLNGEAQSLEDRQRALAKRYLDPKD